MNASLSEIGVVGPPDDEGEEEDADRREVFRVGMLKGGETVRGETSMTDRVALWFW